MKKLAPLIAIVLLAGLGYYVWTSGLLTGTEDVGVKPPTSGPDLPDVGIPDAGEAADGAEKGANGVIDWLVGLPPSAWRLVGVFMIVAAIVWVIKNPKRLAIALGLGVVALLVFIIGGR